MNELFRYQSLMMYAQIYDDDNFIISGYLQIIDLSKLNLAFLTQFDPILVKKLGVYADKAAPMRMKGVHFINCPKEAQAILSIARSLMSEKLQKRVSINKSFW